MQVELQRIYFYLNSSWNLFPKSKLKIEKKKKKNKIIHTKQSSIIIFKTSRSRLLTNFQSHELVVLILKKKN